jgi:predicted TIM-barrel fold metal-dependent hydrolase
MTGLGEGTLSAAEIRERLGHPVVDADGHTLEFWPALATYMRAEGIPVDTATPRAALGLELTWHLLSDEERARERRTRFPWWPFPARNTLDLATAAFPRLLRTRLDELGLDFSVVYPSMGMSFLRTENAELRQAACRALNRYHAEAFADVSDRLTPAAVVPMNTPEEAIAGLEHAVLELGLKAVLIPSFVRRRVEAVAGRPAESVTDTTWLDFFGLDSVHDYDPFWARCIALGVSPASHSGGVGWGSRRSISSYVYNHIGNFAASGEAMCKSLFLGGVTRRNPRLRIAFLEGGVAWAVSLLNDLVSHWEKRNAAHVAMYDPAEVDRPMLDRLRAEYGGAVAAAADGDAGDWPRESPIPPHLVDEFVHCGIADKTDIARLFTDNFFFGCEADDPLVSLGFDTRLSALGVRLNAFFGSDIGHWDVPDMLGVMHEAYEAVEDGRLDPDQFRDFVFTNPVRFYVESNPGFFRGTAVESAVESLAAPTR